MDEAGQLYLVMPDVEIQICTPGECKKYPISAEYLSTLVDIITKSPDQESVCGCTVGRHTKYQFKPESFACLIDIILKSNSSPSIVGCVVPAIETCTFDLSPHPSLHSAYQASQYFEKYIESPQPTANSVEKNILNDLAALEASSSPSLQSNSQYLEIYNDLAAIEAMPSSPSIFSQSDVIYKDIAAIKEVGMSLPSSPSVSPHTEPSKSAHSPSETKLGLGAHSKSIVMRYAYPEFKLKALRLVSLTNYKTSKARDVAKWGFFLSNNKFICFSCGIQLNDFPDDAFVAHKLANPICYHLLHPPRSYPKGERCKSKRNRKSRK